MIKISSNQRKSIVEKTDIVDNYSEVASHNIRAFFPPRIQKELDLLGISKYEKIEEIRCRTGKPLIFITDEGSCGISEAGKVVEDVFQSRNLSKEEMALILQRISQCSAYAWDEEFRRGYLTLPKGHRVGLVGKGVLQDGRIKTLKDISGLNFRIAKEVKGVATKILPYVLEKGRICNTLIVSPPRCGKTTLLRDLVRQLSDGIPSQHFVGVNIGIVDERSEIAGCLDGVAQQDVGIRTDVLDGCPKAEGMVMLIRSMGPQVIATDEIGRKEDFLALEDALNAGISIITTVHGSEMSDLTRNPYLHRMIEQKLFQRIIFLSRKRGVGTVEEVLDIVRSKRLV